MKTNVVLELIEKAERNKQIELDLSNNQLTSLPPEIGKLTDLKELKWKMEVDWIKG